MATVSLEKAPAYTDEQVATMVRAYLVCALWLSTDDDGEPLDYRYSVEDVADTTSAREDVENFLEYVGGQVRNIDPEQCGHDFWLTRNHHGAGFWDRGLGSVGDALTTAAHTFGEEYLYAGDDGALHFGGA